MEVTWGRENNYFITLLPLLKFLSYVKKSVGFKVLWFNLVWEFFRG
jgi:hypothetical protein